MAGFDMTDYVTVNKRIEAFYAAHPEGSIQSEIHTLTDKLVVVRAWVYRTPDDSRPCIAHSQLGIPGKTSFTKDSEVENAETSAVGRALAMMGFEVRKGMASQEEVRNKTVPREISQPEPEATEKPKPEWWTPLTAMLAEYELKSADLAKPLGVSKVTSAAIQKYIDDSGAHWRLALEGLCLSAKNKEEAVD